MVNDCQKDPVTPDRWRAGFYILRFRREDEENDRCQVGHESIKVNHVPEARKPKTRSRSRSKLPDTDSIGK